MCHIINKTLLSALFVSLLLLGCKSAEEPPQATSTPQKADIQAKEYIAALDYLKLHPEQQTVSKKFSDIVRADPVPVAGNSMKKVVVAFVYPGEQASDYWRRSVRSFVNRMKVLNIDFDLHEFFSKGGGVEVLKQEQQLREALEKDPDYLVFTLDVNRHKPFIERILARGRPTLILQNITTPLSIWEKKQPYYVGFDHGIGTQMLADYYLTKFNKQDSYGLLYYSEGYVSRMRGDSFIQYMQEQDGPVLLSSYYTDGQVDKAKQAALEILHKSQPKFLYACSTDVALGAIEALEEQDKTGEILVNGWGGGSAELAAIADGKMSATVMRMNDDNGVAMAEIIRLGILGRSHEIPTVFSGEFALITPDLATDVINSYKARAFRYSSIDDTE